MPTPLRSRLCCAHSRWRERTAGLLSSSSGWCCHRSPLSPPPSCSLLSQLSSLPRLLAAIRRRWDNSALIEGPSRPPPRDHFSSISRSDTNTEPRGRREQEREETRQTEETCRSSADLLSPRFRWSPPSPSHRRKAHSPIALAQRSTPGTNSQGGTDDPFRQEARDASSRAGVAVSVPDPRAELIFLTRCSLPLCCATTDSSHSSRVQRTPTSNPLAARFSSAASLPIESGSVCCHFRFVRPSVAPSDAAACDP